MRTPDTRNTNGHSPSALRTFFGFPWRDLAPRTAPSGAARSVAFGSLVDLARLQVGLSSVEICDACNTMNMGSALYCKCCSHKLPAFIRSW